MSRNTQSAKARADIGSAAHSGAMPLSFEADVVQSAAPPVSASATEMDSLAAAVQDALRRGVHGLCFSPYLDGQAPGASITEAQIRQRLQRIRPHTRWVRSFSCTDGNEAGTASCVVEVAFSTVAASGSGELRSPPLPLSRPLRPRLVRPAPLFPHSHYCSPCASFIEIELNSR